ncbi:hypothetical protein CEXT_294671 [Caerostris extrusa]|uniref:Uncharacterized protein n=1 Tax=Caerostris extrusa TaxID=172846 RepID=A0AAV4NYD7_CAEEX|nr:hypothetical protein CEXT_294671 [Caerostris extrusa]
MFQENSLKYQIFPSFDAAVFCALMGSLSSRISSRSWVPKHVLFPLVLAAKLRRKKELLKNLFRVLNSFTECRISIFCSCLSLGSPSSNVYFC